MQTFSSVSQKDLYPGAHRIWNAKTSNAQRFVPLNTLLAVILTFLRLVPGTEIRTTYEKLPLRTLPASEREAFTRPTESTVTTMSPFLKSSIRLRLIDDSESVAVMPPGRQSIEASGYYETILDDVSLIVSQQLSGSFEISQACQDHRVGCWIPAL